MPTLPVFRALVLAVVLAGCSSDKAPGKNPPAKTGGSTGEGGGGAGGGSTGGKGGGGGADAGAISDGGVDIDFQFYVGCANPTGEIQLYRYAEAPGEEAFLLLRKTIAAGSPTSNSALHPNKKLLYVNHRLEGKISAFSIAGDGTLMAVGSVPVPLNLGQLPDAGAPDAGTDGGTPAPTNPSTQTLEVDGAGKFLLAPNYEAHTTLVFGLDAMGLVGKLASWHSGGMRAHHTLISPNGRFVLVPYLGSHQIVTYAFDAATGAIKPHATVTVAGTTPGPRHIALHPNGKWLYSINETSGTLSLFNFDQIAGTLGHVESLSSFQPDYTGVLKNASEVVVHPSGKFVYVSNRLDNMVEGSIGAFAVNQADGKVTPIGFLSSRGKTPRHLALSSDGRILVAANQNSNNMAMFAIDSSTGALTFRFAAEVCATPFFVRPLTP